MWSVAIARKLKVGSAQRVPNVSVVLLQCLKQEHSINYHDYLKRRGWAGEGESLAPCGSILVLLFPRLCIDVTMTRWSWRQELGTVVLLHFGNWGSLPPLPSFQHGQECRGEAGDLRPRWRGQVRYVWLLVFSSACLWVTFCSLCADKLFIKKDISDLLVREAGVRPGILLSLELFSPGSTK